jgi:molybdate transport system ATP-binding protein
MSGTADALEVEARLSRKGEREFSLDVKFRAEPGITIMFGPSGSGKSTTLAVIAGLLKPASGRVALGQEVWFDSARGIDRPIHERSIAFVFQSLALFPHLSAVENVAYGIDRGLERAERRARAMAMLERMKVAHVAGRRPGTLSGGEAQRVALARAFARSPRLVLLDEPFSALDRDLRLALARDVRAYVDEARLPLLQVTHHRNEARAMGDRVVMMEAGRVRGAGALDDWLPKLDDTMPNKLDRGAPGH